MTDAPAIKPSMTDDRATEPSAEAQKIADNVLPPAPWGVKAGRQEAVVIIALALDAFAAQAVQRERERCLSIVKLWDGRSERFADMPYEGDALQRLIAKHIEKGWQP